MAVASEIHIWIAAPWNHSIVVSRGIFLAVVLCEAFFVSDPRNTAARTVFDKSGQPSGILFQTGSRIPTAACQAGNGRRMRMWNQVMAVDKARC